jgi:hypothetical protein
MTAQTTNPDISADRGDQNDRTDTLTRVGLLIDQSKENHHSAAGEYRENALQYYEGEVDFPRMGTDRSGYVSKDVSDTIGLVMPGIMRAFFGSTRIVEYKPRKQSHMAFFEKAQDYVNDRIMNELDGYEIFHSGFFNTFLMGNGVIKYWWDATPEYEVEEYNALTEGQIALMEEKEDSRELESTVEVRGEPYPDPNHVEPTPDEIRQMMLQDPAIQQQFAQAGADPSQFSDEDVLAAAQQFELVPPPVMLYDVTIRRMIKKGRLQVIALPPEEFILAEGETTVDDTTRFCAHWRQPTRSDLIEEGHDKAKVWSIPAASVREEDSDREQDETYTGAEYLSTDKATEKVDIYECYVLMDKDGDGIAERYRVIVGGPSGGRVLLSEEKYTDPLPFADLRHDPVPHRYRGRSIYDEAKDIQDVKTVTMRGILDNLYDVLMPQTAAFAGSLENPEELVDPTFGGVLWVKPGQTPPVPATKEYLAPQIAPVLEMMDRINQKRTGISDQAQALDMEALQNQSATAVNAAVSAIYTKIEQYARNLAQCKGMKRLFNNILELLIRYQDWEEAILVKNEWVAMRPSDWESGLSACINTGLGTGSRERDFAILQGIAQKIEMLIGQMGPFNEFADISDLFKVYRDMSEAGGMRDPETFFKDISKDEIAARRKSMEEQQAAQGQQPPPEVMKVQMQAEADRVKHEQQMQLENQKLAQNEQLERYRIDREFEFKEREAQREHERRVFEANREFELAAMQNARMSGVTAPDININKV